MDGELKRPSRVEASCSRVSDNAPLSLDALICKARPAINQKDEVTHGLLISEEDRFAVQSVDQIWGEANEYDANAD